MRAHVCKCLCEVCESLMPTLLPCGLISSPLTQKWEENISTEVPLKQRCSESIKTSNENNCCFKKRSYVFSRTPGSLLSAEGRSRRLLLSVSSRRFRCSMSDQRSWLPTGPLDFRCYGDCERLKRVLISWHRDCFSLSCRSLLFHCFSLPFCLSLVPASRLAFLFVLGKFIFASSEREGREQGYK